MSLTSRVLLGLFLGLAAGIAVAATGHRALLALIPLVEPVGTLWLNALRMTIVPLVVSLLVAGTVAANAAAKAGQVGTRTMLVVGGMLTAAATFTALAAPLLLAWFPVDPGTAAALRSTLRKASEAPAAVPGFADWITGLIPANPIQTAADGAMLPLVAFSLLLGMAATRLAPEPRQQLLGLFNALAEGMLVIVHWVLQLAPVGVFALVFPFGVRAGVGAVAALGHYVLQNSLLCVVATLVLYPVTGLSTGIPIRRFARAAAPSQAVAFSTRSSLASLPAMLESAQRQLRLSPATSGLVLPLTVSLMRLCSPITNLGAAIFAAALFGIDLSPARLAAGAVVTVLLSLGEVGLPGQAGLVASYTPIFMTMGVPLEVIGLMLAVETIPDTFATVGNVTADMAATAIVARGAGEVDGEEAAVPEVEVGAVAWSEPQPTR